jgi:hypothetical protein
MPHIRKAQAGNDSFGNEWAKDGSVVEVPYEQAVELLAIGDGGFSEVDGTGAEPVEEPTSPDPDPEPEPVEEPAPEPETPVDEAPKPPTRRRTSKAKADDKTVEE